MMLKLSSNALVLSAPFHLFNASATFPKVAKPTVCRSGGVSMVCCWWLGALCWPVAEAIYVSKVEGEATGGGTRPIQPWPRRAQHGTPQINFALGRLVLLADTSRGARGW